MTSTMNLEATVETKPRTAKAPPLTKNYYGPAWHGIHRVITLPSPLKTVFSFFSDARNLEKITPPELHFNIANTDSIELEEGCHIQYNLKLMGVPFKWLTRINQWEPPFAFVDEQEQGPFRNWRHTHSFVSLSSDQTLMRDVVRYRLPFWPIGEAVHPLVAAMVDRIFDYRQRAVSEIFVHDAGG